MKTRDHWQKLARRTNDPAVWSGYKNFRNEVKRELRLAQKTFVEGQIRQNVNDTNTMWKTIRSCIPKKSASATRAVHSGGAVAPARKTNRGENKTSD